MMQNFRFVMRFFSVLFFFICVTFSCANPLLLDDNTTHKEILSHSEIYIDTTQSLTIKDIQNKDADFQKHNKPFLGYGYSPDFAVWVKFSLTNQSNTSIDKLIEYANTLTTKVEFFDLSHSETPQTDGLLNIRASRKTINPTFTIHLEPHETKTFYIRASSYITTLIIKLNVWDKDAFYNHELYHQGMLFLFFGAMFILGLYNLFIFFYTKDLSYLFYVCYIMAIILHQLIYVGIGMVYFFDSQVIAFLIKNAALLVTLPVLSLAFFTKYFLNIKQYPKLNIVLKIGIAILLVATAILLSTDMFNKYRSYITVSLLLYLIFITIYAVIKKNKQANFILLGWCAIFLAVLFMFLSSAGVFNIYLYFPYYIELSFLFEATIFSIALANRIKQLQEDKERTNLRFIEQKENEKQRLAVQVEEKTKHLEEKTKDLEHALGENQLLMKELHHRVKNNMQTIVSLIRLQNDKSDNSQYKNVLSTVQNRISAMSHLHELLYQQNNLAHVNAYEYFDLLIEDIRNSFDSDIDIHFEINAELPIEQAIYCGLILNELVTNAFKYAFPENKGTIYIALMQQESDYYLKIKDDGIGYDTTQQYNSLGTNLISLLAKRQLKGTITTDATDGVSVTITWSMNGKNKNSHRWRWIHRGDGN